MQVVFEKDNSNIYALMSDICVLKNFQNQDIVGRVRANSLANNLSAIRAYEKHGFKLYEITYEKIFK